jgi:hypothetical protein
MNQACFADRVNIPVTGDYTQRDIYLWYDAGIKQRAQPLIDLIKKNAQIVNQADERLHPGFNKA